MSAPTVQLDGKAHVIVQNEAFDRLATLAKAADLRQLTEPDADGNYPAMDYARASLARKTIRDRAAAGLNQRELAVLAGIRVTGDRNRWPTRRQRRRRWE